jgi:outer membrane protein OmpA-like peptidoglycan-associated protein
VQPLDRAFNGLKAQGKSAPLALTLDRAQVESRYADLLRSEVPPPKIFTLHFQNDKAVLTDASRALLPEIIAAVRERGPTEVTVFGHADATGTSPYNLKLSAARAQVVADWLRKQDPLLEVIDVQYFGETRPLPGTPPGRAEANRRAEIMIL